MNLKIKIYLISLLFIPSLIFSQNDDMPVNDTIRLSLQHVEGRWIEENNQGQSNIYIFKDDYSFFKAVDRQDVLIFNVSGKFRLSNDSMRIVYQDLSGQNMAKARVRTMHLRVIALSDQELNVYKTERNQTSFVRLRRQTIR